MVACHSLQMPKLNPSKPQTMWMSVAPPHAIGAWTSKESPKCRSLGRVQVNCTVISWLLYSSPKFTLVDIKGAKGGLTEGMRSQKAAEHDSGSHRREGASNVHSIAFQIEDQSR